MSPRRSSRARPTSSTLPHHSTGTRGSGRHRHHDDSIDHDFRDETTYESRHRNNSAPSGKDTENVDNEIDETGSQEDEEVTRCICGFQEYQGEDEHANTSDSLFIQCDKCSVWQHGFCVGITDNEMVPENYFCEKCRPDYHKLVIRPHGPKTSVYLPLNDTPTPSESFQKDHPAKRRSTMNSRDAAYDEAVLARVLEESKVDTNKPSANRGSTRGRKRGTSEGSDEPKDYKRARTSESDTPTTGTVDSGDEKHEKSGNHKKNRHLPSRNSSNSAVPLKRTTTRSKALDKTKDSKKEDSEHSDEFANKPLIKATKPPTNSIAEETLPVVAEVVVPDTPIQGRRNGRSAGNGRRKGAVNKASNTYRPSEDPEHSASPVMGRDISQNGFEKHNNLGGSKDDGNVTNISADKASKPRVTQPKTTIADMSKRVNAIMEFIQHTQVEMALKNNRPVQTRSASQLRSTVNDSAPKAQNDDDFKGTLRTTTTTTTTAPQITITKSDDNALLGDKVGQADLDRMHSTEIMDVLTRKLVHWQQTFGTAEKT